MNRKQFVATLVLPAFVILVVLSVYPLVEVIHLSLINKSLVKPASGQFVGVANFGKLLIDRRFWNALKVTMLWEAITVTFSLGLGVLFALLMYRNIGRRLQGVLSIVFILPAVIPRVAAAYTWRFMYSPLLGVFNYFLGLVGVKPVEFLADRTIALASVALIDIWQWSLLLSVIILGVLDSIPEEPIEAACIDGVERWELHRYITLPMVAPTLVSLLFLKIIESFRTFDLIYVLTKGGPGIATETIDLYAYNVGLALEGNISYGAGISFMMLIITLLIANVLWRFLKHES